MTGRPCGPSGIHDKPIGSGGESETLSLPADLELGLAPRDGAGTRAAGAGLRLGLG